MIIAEQFIPIATSISLIQETTGASRLPGQATLPTGATSTAVIFTIIEATTQPGSRCVIATATYGSEAALQVQALRDFRETIALRTFTGSSLMSVFNSWYYSWSPPVAATIAPNDSLRAVMTVVLQPIFYVLQPSTAMFTALSFSSEFAIVMAGFVAAALIGLVYFAPIITLAFVGVTRLKSDVKLPSATKVFLLYSHTLGDQYCINCNRGARTSTPFDDDCHQRLCHFYNRLYC